MKITNRTKKDQIMAMNSLGVHDFRDCAKKLRDDEDVVLRFTKCYWFNFEYASDRLKKDRRFVKTVIENDPFCFIYADDILKSDKKYIMELIKISNAQILHHASKEIREILFEHLKQPAIDYLKNELKKEEVKNENS